MCELVSEIGENLFLAHSATAEAWLAKMTDPEL